MSQNEIDRFINVIETSLSDDNDKDKDEYIDMGDWCKYIFKEYQDIKPYDLIDLFSRISKNKDKNDEGKFIVNKLMRFIALMMIQYINILYAIKINDDELKNSSKEKMKMVIDKINTLTV